MVVASAKSLYPHRLPYLRAKGEGVGGMTMNIAIDDILCLVLKLAMKRNGWKRLENRGTRIFLVRYGKP
jgi:hypothetical protein